MLRYLSTGLRPFGDYPMPPHKRFNWEFYAVVSGRLAPTFSNQTSADLVSDTLWLFRPGCEHGWRAETGQSCEVVVFHYSAVSPGLQRLTDARGFACVPLRAGDKRQLIRLAGNLSPHVQQRSLLSDFHIERGLLDLSLLMLQRSAPSGEEAAVEPPVDASREIAPSSGMNEARVLAAEKWFKSHLSQAPSADDVVRATGISPSHLRRLFARVRHCSPRDVFNRLRIEHAMQLLAQSDLKVAGVASESGFATPSHFCEAFRKALGATPNAWRRFAYIEYQHPEARAITRGGPMSTAGAHARQKLVHAFNVSINVNRAASETRQSDVESRRKFRRA